MITNANPLGKGKYIIHLMIPVLKASSIARLVLEGKDCSLAEDFRLR